MAPREKPAPLSVRLLRKDERLREAVDFIGRRFRAIFGTEPGPPQIVFAAYRNSAIVGTMALGFADEHRPFSFEHAFDIQGMAVPARRDGVQYERWIARGQFVSEALIYAATVHALALGKTYGWCVVKQPAADRLAGLGILLHSVSEAILREDRIATDDRPYYLDEPRPTLCLMRLEQIRAAVLARIAGPLGSGLISIEITT